MPPTASEYRTLAEGSAKAGRVVTCMHLLRQVWRLEAEAYLSPMRTVIRSRPSKLGDDEKEPTYIYTELRNGYRMPKGEVAGRAEA